MGVKIYRKPVENGFFMSPRVCQALPDSPPCVGTKTPYALKGYLERPIFLFSDAFEVR